MSTTTASLPQPPAVAPPALSVPVFVAGELGMVAIPPGIKDLDSFRRWAKSDAFPARGRFSFLDGLLWVDLSMEQLYTHNQVKGEVSRVLLSLVRETGQGLFLPDGMLLSNPGVNLSTVADGVFVSFAALQNGRVRQVPGSRAGFVELEGSPEMVLEVVSDSSVEKDLERLPPLYWRSAVEELWRIDARNNRPFRAAQSRHRGLCSRSGTGWLAILASLWQMVPPPSGPQSLGPATVYPGDARLIHSQGFDRGIWT